MEATSTAMSVDQALAIGVSSSSRRRAASRSTGLPARRARSAATAVDRQMARAASILRLHQHQGAAHVRMVEQARGQGPGPGRAALLALQREGQRLLVGALGDAHALDADLQARGVHHHEHGRQALVRRADQLGRGALVEHDAGRRGVDAELVLEARRRAARWRSPSAPSSPTSALGREEQGEAARAGRRVGQARQHQVDDVVGDVVVAPGDEDLLAGEPVAAVAVRLGAGGRWRRGPSRPAARSGSSCRSTRRRPACGR